MEESFSLLVMLRMNKLGSQSFCLRVQIIYGTVMWYYAKSLVSLGLYVSAHALDSMVCLDDPIVIRGMSKCLSLTSLKACFGGPLVYDIL